MNKGLRTVFAALAALVVLCGLAVAQDQGATTFSKPFDEVWDAAIAALDDVGLALDNADKASGVLTSDWTSFKKKDGYADAKRPPAIQMEFDRSAKLTIRVKASDDGSVAVAVDGAFKQSYGFKGPEKTRSCPSTGALEKKYIEALRAKLNQHGR